MREEPIYTEYSVDRECRFEVYRRGRQYEVWVQRRQFDEYTGWCGYLDTSDCMHIADSLERAIEISRGCIILQDGV